MAKSSSQANASKNGSATATPKKTAWKGISIKPKSRPASVNSQESRKSTHTIGSIEKPVASPLSAEFDASSVRNESTTALDAVDLDTNKQTAPKSNETTNDISASIHTKDEDDGTSTPRAGSRRSSFTALDSASEVFEDAFDDHDDYFDDVPVFDGHQDRDQMDSALLALGKGVDEDPARNEAVREGPATVDEIESLRIAEAPSTIQRNEVDIDGGNGIKPPTVAESMSQPEEPSIEQPDQSLHNVSQVKPQEPHKSTGDSVPMTTNEDPKPVIESVSLSKEREVQEHRVADVLADLENTETTIKAFEFPTVDIDSARAGDTSEKSPVEHTDSGVFDAKSSEEKSEPTRNTSFSDSLDRKSLEMDQQDRLGSLLPAMEDSARETIAVQPRPPQVSVDNASITAEDHARAARSHEFEHPIEDPIDLDMFRDNVITIPTVDPKSIPINYLTPREQEEADEPVREGMRNLFDNKFMNAKNTFLAKASVEPLHALGLGAMAFIKAMMTYQEKDIEIAMTALATAYTIAKAQIDNTQFKKPLKEAVSQYFSAMLTRNNASGLPNNPTPITRANSNGVPREAPTFLPNGILRAHVIKAECCLLMSILQLSQESVVNYLKCGLNLRRVLSGKNISGWDKSLPSTWIVTPCLLFSLELVPSTLCCRPCQQRFSRYSPHLVGRAISS
ncbi:hypothetical protein BJV82DRAFT_404445 [Fennellomyces sp. T-0311]|nr:hypothetical protein BJV82DRAFT_404445 [Fennellomyces sp. T-0311]